MRIHLILAAFVAAFAAAPLPALAQDCPPGLAKKSPPCVPPGQAKKGDRHWSRGEVLTGDYVLVRERGRYGLPPLGPGEQYYRMGDTVLRVDAGTKQILDVIALAASALN